MDTTPLHDLGGNGATEVEVKKNAVLPLEAWLKLNYGFILKRGRTPSPAAKAFIAIVREVEAGIPQ